MDNAIQTGKYPAYTLTQLRGFVASGAASNIEAMRAEIARREQVAAGNAALMSQSERLRLMQTRKEIA